MRKSSFQKTLICLVLLMGVLATPVSAMAATLSLSPATGTFNRGCNFSLNVDVDTAGTQTDGTDAIIIYDPTRFSVTSITSGSIYEDYPGNNDDPATGKITVSGLASVTQAFTGKGTLATLNFSVKANAPTGTTPVRFDFDPNDKTKTTDSNVVERGTVVDVLNAVTNGNYTVGTGVCTAGGAPAPGGAITNPGGGGIIGTTPSAQYKQLPSGGTEQFTFTLAIVGSILTVLGILGLAIL